MFIPVWFIVGVTVCLALKAFTDFKRKEWEEREQREREEVAEEQRMNALHDRCDVHYMLAVLYSKLSEAWDKNGGDYSSEFDSISDEITRTREKFSFWDSVEFTTSKGVRMKAKGVKNV
ncbi:hypothetical protein [Kluyvera georgiana]|uniref:hypothetical protein n=1 Tax=Kluyvera georgiana TaxID=73098 RepID=UPI00321FFACD